MKTVENRGLAVMNHLFQHFNAGDRAVLGPPVPEFEMAACQPGHQPIDLSKCDGGKVCFRVCIAPGIGCLISDADDFGRRFDRSPSPR